MKDEKEEFEESMERILTELRNYTAFLQRVSKRDAPDYYDVIKNPMDLGTMQKKLKSGQYKNKAQFQGDLDLIWDNCLLYNASPQHPLRRNATMMRKKANHLLEFLSEKGDIKDILSHWQPPPVQKTTEEPQPSAPPVAEPPAPPVHEMEVDDSDQEQAPFTQHVALRRTAESTLVFSDLDPHLAVPAIQGTSLSRRSPVEAASSDTRALPATLAMLEQVGHARGVDPLGSALGLQRPRKEAAVRPHDALHAWWASCGTDAMIGAGLPSLAYAGRHPTSPSRDTPPSSRKPMDRRGIPRMMARNIQTLRRLHHTHQKFFRLADVVEHELPIPADLAQASSDEECEEGEEEENIGATAPVNADDAETGSEASARISISHSPAGAQAPTSPSETQRAPQEDHVADRANPFPRLSHGYAREQIMWQVRMLLAHTGFDGSHTNALHILTDVTREYMMGLARTLRLYCDRFGSEMGAEEMIVHALHNSGGTHVQKLDAYIKNDVKRYGATLRDWLRKLKAAYREQLTNLGRAVVEDDELLARDGEALALGHFAEGLGDDFFGFRELGLDRELGLAGLSVPSRLFFGRAAPSNAAVADGERKVAPTYAPPPPVVLVSRASLPAQIGLLRPWYAAHLVHGEEPKSTDIVPEVAPERPRYKVPTSGKLPPRPLYGEVAHDSRGTTVNSTDKKAPTKTPPVAKRKRAGP
ncbi:Transcriptional activator spt7 [Malassezia brasiliensis]|uniref:Transcriptional activator spt7 n=1 Tax=Malassezia brasiliensis TaxID=1821822 RepID=A0AAF0DXN7_9BASI|nr:Transcriptional activator spt7 [Malassezia brasiliensis]